MKKIIYSFLLATVLSSCYEDKGNYEYTLDSMNEITSVTFSPAVAETAKGKVIEVQQALNEDDTYRRIDVTLEQTREKDAKYLQYYWERTYTDVDGKTVKDTIHSNGFLEFNLPVGKAMSYSIFLKIYDEKTTLSHYSKFKIETRPLFKNSLFVLHGEAGVRKLGNIEIIGNETKTRTDITEIVGGNGFENAVGLAYTTYLGKSSDKMDKEVNSFIVFNNGKEAVSYNPFGMEKNEYDVFRPNTLNESFIFKKMMIAGYGDRDDNRRIALSENGEVCIGNYTHALYKPGYQIEENGGNDRHQSDYNITAAVIDGQRFIFWDAKHNRFLHCYSREDNYDFPIYEIIPDNTYLTSSVEMRDAYVDFTTLEDVPSPENMTAVLGYINYGEESYKSNNSYFIFKDENGEFYRYELTRIKLDGDSKPSNSIDREANKPAFSITGEKLKGFMSDCDIASVTYNSSFTTNYLFYSDGKNIYRYSVLSGDNVQVYTAPEGYDITVMKFRTEDSSVYTGDLRRILSIGLYNGTNGAVAEIKFNTAADIDEDFEPLFYDKGDDGSKWGKIKDLQFTDEYLYYNAYGENNENE